MRADRLAEALGVDRLWIKNDAVNFPTLSFKDRVVSVALSKAREFGFATVGCASTGNLANSVAAAWTGIPGKVAADHSTLEDLREPAEADVHL